MTGQIRFKVLTDNRLTLVHYQGVVDIPVWKDHLTKLVNTPNYNPDFNAITDFGDCEFNVSNRDIQIAADHMKSLSGIMGNRKHAFISNNAEQQVISSLFSMLMGRVPVAFNVFDSIVEALNYVGVKHTDLETVQQELKDLGDMK